MQQSLFDSCHDNTPVQLNMPDADVIYYPNFIAPVQATKLMEVLSRTVPWKQDQITLYGKTYDVPRLQVWYGDPEASYEYSKLTLAPIVWTQELLELKLLCEQAAGVNFNSVLANLYRDGSDGVGRHADDEPELGIQPVIASLSFGQTRNLDFYHNNLTHKLRLPLESGSLLVMKGPTQHNWQHSVAKTKKAMAARINLTFRFIN